jgi:hypothetical protein
MAFIDDHQISRWYISPRQRLDRANLYRGRPVCPLMLGLYDPDVVDPVPLKLLGTLVDQANGRDAEQDPLALVQRHADDVGRHNGLASPSGHLNHGPGFALAEAVPEFVDSVSLIVA